MRQGQPTLGLRPIPSRATRPGSGQRAAEPQTLQHYKSDEQKPGESLLLTPLQPHPVTAKLTAGSSMIQFIHTVFHLCYFLKDSNEAIKLRDAVQDNVLKPQGSAPLLTSCTILIHRVVTLLLCC